MLYSPPQKLFLGQITLSVIVAGGTTTRQPQKKPTWIRCVDVKLTLAALGKVVRVGIGKQNVNVQLEATVRLARLERGRERARMEGDQHFRSTVGREKGK